MFAITFIGKMWALMGQTHDLRYIAMDVYVKCVNNMNSQNFN